MLGTSGTVTTIAGVFLRLTALRSPARRRLLAVRRSGIARGRGTHGDELSTSAPPIPASAPSAPISCSPAAPSSTPFAVFSLPAAARRRSRAARGHAGRDDARRRRVGRSLTRHGAAQGRQTPHSPPRAPGSSARSTIPMWRAPSAKVFAPAPLTSSPRSTTNFICSSRARASSISAPRRAAGAKSRCVRVGAKAAAWSRSTFST